MTERYRIEVCLSTSPEWEWTAYLTEWDGSEWRYEAAEDGDTQEEALETLREINRLARSAPVVFV